MNRLPDMDQRDQDGDWDADEDAVPLMFKCACGDTNCVGFDDDAGNIRIGREWFASDCKVARDHPEVVRSRELDAIYDRSRR